jgi:hypothetical protein|nr:hypothetical protein [Moraxella osloensis]
MKTPEELSLELIRGILSNTTKEQFLSEIESLPGKYVGMTVGEFLDEYSFLEDYTEILGHVDFIDSVKAFENFDINHKFTNVIVNEITSTSFEKISIGQVFEASLKNCYCEEFDWQSTQSQTYQLAA